MGQGYFMLADMPLHRALAIRYYMTLLDLPVPHPFPIFHNNKSALDIATLIQLALSPNT